MKDKIANLDVEKMDDVRRACALNNRLEMDFLENPNPTYSLKFFCTEGLSEHKKNEIEEEIRWQHSTEYLSVDLYFKKQYKQEKNLNEKDFALNEKKRIEGIIEQIKILGGDLFKNYNRCKTYQQAINYINYLTNSIKEERITEERNPHPRIFTNAKGWKIFERYREQIPTRTQLVEYSFIYWAMVEDGFIYSPLRPTEFINFIEVNFGVILTELKQYENSKQGGKIPKYNAIKEVFQHIQ